jgi:hypothetical protein
MALQTPGTFNYGNRVAFEFFCSVEQVSVSDIMFYRNASYRNEDFSHLWIVVGYP